MANSRNAQEIGSDWTDINTLFGIAAGTEMLVQVVGAPQDTHHCYQKKSYLIKQDQE